MIIFTIKGTKLSIPVVNLSARDNQRLSKLLSKGFARSVYWNEYKTESDNKNMTNKIRGFLESKFVGVGRLSVLVYTNPGNSDNRSNAQKYYLTKVIIKSYNVIIYGKNLL